MTLLDDTLDHLRVLVGFDTRNPPRAIDSGGIFDYLHTQLPDFELTLTDHGAGAVSLLAMRGAPRLLFNVHLDTVPDAPHWNGSPFELRVDGERAVGLGACDIKGAAAALLAVANASNGPMAILFSSDEEANDARCIAAFLRRSSPPPTPDSTALLHAAEPSSSPLPPGEGAPKGRERGFVPEAVIVAEPTCGEAVLAHRGIQVVALRFAGHAGHASAMQAPVDSAVHQSVRWGNAALDFAASEAHQRFGGLTGLRLNIGRIEGGIKANIIAPAAELRVGLRRLPSMDPDCLLESLRTLIDPAPADFAETFRGDALPAGDTAGAEERRLVARDLADELGIPIGNAVDFWTEAALFSAAGLTVFVYGPGDIAQAHSADEWVALESLRQYADTIHRIVTGGRA